MNNNYLPHLFFILIFLTILMSSLQITSADVISVNTGGSQEIALTPDRYVEGFFFGVGPVCGNGILEDGEQCDDGNTVSGDGCSAACITEAEEEPPSDGGGGAPSPTSNLLVDPTQFDINLAVNTNTERIVRVTNLGSSTATVAVSQQGLNNMVILGNTSLTIAPGETVELDVVFVALSETGIFTGKIIIGNEEVLVSINVKTKLLLFDSNIVVLNEDYEVPQGDALRTLVTLIPLGDPERLDVTLHFVVKDYRNRIFFTKSETLLVEEQVELNRNFDTGALPLGDYVIGLVLEYPNGVAPSSAYFKITEKALPEIFGRIVLFLIVMILILLILIIIILIIRRLKEKKQGVSPTGQIIQQPPR